MKENESTAQPKDEVWNRQKTIVTTLLEQSGAFAFQGTLDTRGIRPLGPEVFQIRYVSEAKRLPIGMGYWPNPFLFAEPGTNSEWLEKPYVGTNIALKMRELDWHGEDISRERAAMMKMNRVFSPQDSARPVRLYGYGASVSERQNSSRKHQFGYLLQEYIPKEYQQFEAFKQIAHVYPIEQRLELIVSVADMIAKIHEANVVHGDVEGPGHDEHLFIHPQTLQVRLIDWSHCNLSLHYDNPKHSVVLLDQAGVGEIMTELIQPDELPEEAKEEFVRIVEKIDEEDEEGNFELDKIYGLSGVGTRELAEDLRKLHLLVDDSKR